LGFAGLKRLDEVGAKETKFYLQKKMNYKPIKFYFSIDEITSMKLKSLIGKPSINAKDFQQIITAIINHTYETQKGKKFK
tara:strand:- start:1122 stop:1361 length:240 start_codon:yes stop_codon:yes gene_type:complete